LGIYFFGSVIAAGISSLLSVSWDGECGVVAR